MRILLQFWNVANFVILLIIVREIFFFIPKQTKIYSHNEKSRIITICMKYKLIVWTIYIYNLDKKSKPTFNFLISVFKKNVFYFLKNQHKVIFDDPGIFQGYHACIVRYI